MVKWTKEQTEAIYASGSDILVAAAAGSGKTAVLVERIIQKLLNKEDPIQIDELLVVTFTNAAAQEMRNRIGAALEQALQENPHSNHLKKQLALVQRAPISTLHSFCMDMVRQYAYMLDIDPAFRIANEMELEILKQDILDTLLEEKYGSEDKEELDRFFTFIDRFSGDRNDAAVEQLILNLYSFSIQSPWPDAWLDELKEVYSIGNTWKESELPWLSIVKEDVKMQLKAMKQELERAIQIASASDGPYHYIETLENDRKMITEVYEKSSSWADVQRMLTTNTWGRLSGKRVDCNEDKKERVKKIRNHCRDRWKKMKNKLFVRDLSAHIADMQELQPVIDTLTELVKEFKHRYNAEKKKRAMADFSDLEHYFLQLLVDPSSTKDHIVPSPIAKQLQSRFRELYIDEYQDTNLVQETILSLMSNQISNGNKFMVGDVKQSIYRFRHADPTLFMDKYKRYGKQEKHGILINLSRNFRSRKHVLNGVNYIFRQILDEEVGEISYDKEAELIYSNQMYEAHPVERPEVELILIDREAQDEEKDSESMENFEDLEKAQLEGRLYAKKIKNWINHKSNPLLIVDKTTEKERPVQYRDIVILLRSMKWAPTIMEELKKQGIPVYAELTTGYFEAIEIKIMISLLKIIDNPRQDIPLASVLRSPIVQLNEDELASIRLANRKSTYYEALIDYKNNESNKTAKKVGQFLDLLETFRVSATQGSLSELIWEIYRKTGFYDFVGGMPGGRQRQANLRALYDRARGFEKTALRGLFRFLRFIERMEERGDDLGSAKALSEQEDVVRIMTIHKSKGLEFPVVLMGAINTEFNTEDLKKKYLLDIDYGFATKYIDPIKRITYPTLYYHAIAIKKRKELLAEEMRVLYVALTRAKEKLVLVGNVDSVQKQRQKWAEIANTSNWLLPAYYRAEAKSYLDWIGPALVRHKQNKVLREDETNLQIQEEIWSDPSKWEVTIVHGSELINIDKKERQANQTLKESITEWKPLKLNDDSLKKYVSKRLSYKYPYEEATETRAKQSVTEIKRQKEIKDVYSSDQLIASFRSPIRKRPMFMQKEKTLSQAEKGTAMHTVMQHLPFQKVLDKHEIEQYVNTYVEREILTKEEANSIDIEAIEQFFTTPIAKKMMEHPQFLREVPFSFTLNSNEVYDSWESNRKEPILIQGVIDCLIPVTNGWIILDYKTDFIMKVTDKEIVQLKNRYALQIELYKRAVESIYREPVIEMYLYFFSKGLLINMEDRAE